MYSVFFMGHNAREKGTSSRKLNNCRNSMEQLSVADNNELLYNKLANLTNHDNCRNSMEQLSVAEGKLGNVMTRLLGVDIFNKKLEMDEERWNPILLVQLISLETLGLSLRDLDTRPTSLRRSRRRRKMTLTAVLKRRR